MEIKRCTQGGNILEKHLDDHRLTFTDLQDASQVCLVRRALQWNRDRCKGRKSLSPTSQEICLLKGKDNQVIVK